jgi:hypothetical protein
MADVTSKSRASKIESHCAYPCPCRKQGELCPITLTDALGCTLCHHIFVVREDGYTLEQVSNAYPYKQLWYWTGRAWYPVMPPLRKSGLTWLVGMLFFITMVLLVLLLALHIRFDSRIVVWVVMMCVLSTLAWLIVYRQS